MITYGNQLWNTSIGNDEKSVIPMKKEAFENLKPLLDNAGLNYYAYAKSDSVVMGVNTKDIDWLKHLVGTPAADKMSIQKPSKPYNPPSKNIIGNVEYRYIPQKSYFSADTDTALKLAQMMTASKIQFSGRVYGNNTKLTVSAADMPKLKEMNEELIKMRSNIVSMKQEKKEIIGSVPYSQIKKKHFYFPRVSPEKYNEIKPQMDKLDMQYSGIIKDNRVIFTIEESQTKEFFLKLNTAINQNLIEKELHSLAFNDNQIALLSNVISVSAEKDFLGIIDRYVEPTFSDEQLKLVADKLIAYMQQPETERLLDKNEILKDIINTKACIDNEMIFGEFTNDNNYSAEQLEIIRNAFDNGVSIDFLSGIDESYSIKELTDVFTAYQNLDIDLINKIMKQHSEESIQSSISEPQENDNHTEVHSEKTERTQKPENELEKKQGMTSEVKEILAKDSQISNVKAVIDPEKEYETNSDTENLSVNNRPTVTCDWSESIAFEGGKTYSVAEFDNIMKQADEQMLNGKKVGLANHNNSMDEWREDDPDTYYQYLGYDKTMFTINMPDGKKYTERQDIGDGDGGLIDFLSKYPNYNDIVALLKADMEIDNPNNLSDYRSRVQKIYEYENSNNVPEEERLTRWYDEQSVSVAKPTYIKDGSEINISEDTINKRFHQLQEMNNEKDTPEIPAPTISEEFEQAGITEKSPFVVSPEVEAELAEKRISEINNDKLDGNFRITDDNLGEGGAKTKFKANVAAISTLKTIEKDNLYLAADMFLPRSVTDEEKEILSKYVGWGSLQHAFEPDNLSWSNEYKQLKELLTDSEYRSASASTLDAFYTAPVIIDGIYSAMKQFGFEGGNVLEPALGVGNFLGRMPEEMSKHSKIYGTEIDSISGRIAQQLYPNADIKVQGFEKNEYQNECFDIAVGNVPFGDLGFTDKKHGTNKLHDFFFAETLDKVKEGGIVAFVTSTGTLDKKDSNIRKMLSDKADLVGAIRLPSGAFKANAGTEVTSDIIFLQKRSIPPLIEPDWVQLGKTDDGLTVNKYYENNPEMVLGKIVEGNKLYGRNDDTMCIPFEGADIGVQLQEAVKKLNATISDERAEPVYPAKENAYTDIPADLRNYSFFEKDDKILFKKTATVCDFRFDNKNSTHKRIKAFIELRDCTRDLLAAQEQDKPDSEITALQRKLNVLYDSFNKDYGLLHSRSNKSLLREDISYSLVAALEKKIENNKLVEKSDLFTKRTIKPAKAVSHVDTAIEALALSVAEKAKVDLGYMEALTDLPQEILIDELHGEIYPVPGTENEYQSSSEYLSGDIRVKLTEAEAALKDGSRMQGNIEALKAALPEPLKAADIDVKPGATWVDKSIYQQFVYDTFNTPDLYREDGRKSFWRKPKNITVDYSEHTGSWRIENKSADSSVVATKKFGTNRINAYQIMEDILNLKEPKLYKSTMVNGEEKRVIDIEATKLAQRKAEKIKTAFKDWIFEDPDRRATLVDKYNNLFNSIKPREYDGSNLRFPGMNSDIHLHEHQKNAIAHSLFGGNTLFAHSVGAGKTFEMIASAMESKRLGLCTKSLFAVPNHLTEQIGDDFRKLYPNSNVLVATKADFKKENRQALFSKIAAGNFDAVIIGHSQLSMLKMSKERQENILNSQIDDIMEGIRELKNDEGSKFQVKAMERTKKSLVKRLENLQKDKQDDIITFEQLGVDKLFVDEAHEFKNLFTPTKLQNVSGISSSASQKALDLFMKCQYLDEKTGGKGIVFATGTPLSNSVTELHTMMRYLEYDFLKSKNLQHFDNWVTVFGNQKTDWELAPAGNKFKQRTRIANYTGLPELISMFKQCADVRTADTLNLDVPNCEMHIVNVEATPFQKTLVEELAERADDVQDRNVEPEVDNMLRITSDGRKLGLDPRLINPDFEDDPNTKLNQCVNNVFKIYEDTLSDKSTQIIFCDLGVPHGADKATSKVNENGETIEDDKSVSEKESLEEECDFCVYDDIKAKLMEKGIPEEQIAFIHSAKTEKAKTELFDKVRNGDVRVLLGSTGKMGTGTNVQDKLIAVHDLDIPWRPADMEQRKGRIVRQGNKNKNVHVFRYVTKGTFDAYSYQTLENKQKFISQIMTSKVPLRKCDDVDQQALSYSEIKALCTGDERIKEKMSLDNEVKELKMLKAEYKNTQYEMQDKVKNFPAYNERCERIIKNLTSDLEHCKQLPIDPETNLPKFSIEIKDTTYTDRTEAAKALETACLELISKSDEPVTIGKFHGFPLTVSYSSIEQGLKATLHGAAQHKSDFSISFASNIKKLENSVFKIENNIDDVKTDLHRQELDVLEAKQILQQPFTQETELENKEKRLVELTEELNEAAAQAKLNNPGKQRTCYFEMAKLKKDSLKRSTPQKKHPAKINPPTNRKKK